jgi:class 3 adenylate cyclase
VAYQRRRFEGALLTLRAGSIALVTAGGMAAMSARPAWLPVVMGLVVGGLALASSELAVAVAVIALSIPIIAAQPVLGFALLVVLIASVRYLGSDGGRAFLILAVSIAGAFLGPVWAGAALAGYLLGAGEGALTAALACLVLEACGIAIGRPMIGATVTGGTGHGILTFAHMPSSLLSAAWIEATLKSIDGAAVTKTIGGFSKVSQPVMLFFQPWFWALGAVAAGTLGARARKDSNVLLSVGAVAAGVAVPALGTAALAAAFKIHLPYQWVGISLVSSLLVAVGFVILWESVFTPIKTVARPPQRRVSMATEDADVDELLRLIATAEDTLTSKHTSNRVVMITDMKSFSRMTEEDGSVATAKAIQRHRDLLLPIVQAHRGSGKSTGGDGLVAAFESPNDALVAAVDMQAALSDYNAAHPDQREIWVRAGLASGEVVLDNGGRPFIGAGLNLAARVMNLADGGQVFATAAVVEAAGSSELKTHSFGEFELKNIAKPVEIVEVLWAANQEPRDPRSTGAAVPESDGD